MCNITIVNSPLFFFFFLSPFDGKFPMNSSQLHLAIRESRVIFGDFLIVLFQGEAHKSCGRVASMQPSFSVLQTFSKALSSYDVVTIAPNAFSGFRRKSSRVQWRVASFAIYTSYTVIQVIHAISLFHSLHKCSLPYGHLKHEAPIFKRVRLQIRQVDE